MARLIRRHSMERLELYDLDKLITVPSSNYQLPPPLPPPRKHHPHRRSSVNPSFERYQFLCNMTRNKTDPIYAATPMFTTIPQSVHEKYHRPILGSYIRPENIRPLSNTSPEPEDTEEVEDAEEEEEEDDKDQKENSEANDDNENQFDSSSSDEHKNDKKNNDDDDDDDDNKGIIQQIFNTDKKT